MNQFNKATYSVSERNSHYSYSVVCLLNIN